MKLNVKSVGPISVPQRNYGWDEIGGHVRTPVSRKLPYSTGERASGKQAGLIGIDIHQVGQAGKLEDLPVVVTQVVHGQGAVGFAGARQQAHK